MGMTVAQLKQAKLEKEVEALQSKAAQRLEEARQREEQISEGLNRMAADGDVVMDANASASQEVCVS